MVLYGNTMHMRHTKKKVLKNDDENNMCNNVVVQQSLLQIFLVGLSNLIEVYDII